MQLQYDVSNQHFLTSLTSFSSSESHYSQMQQALDLDELFHDCYFDDLALPEPVTSSTSPVPPTTTATTAAAATAAHAKRPAADAGLSNPPQDKKPSSAESSKGTSSKPAASLTESQKIERRERNREHAKRSRLRKKFLLESLQEQVEGLQGEIQSLKDIIKRELPDKAERLLNDMEGNTSNDVGPKTGDYTPLPMPSEFGPLKTLTEAANDEVADTSEEGEVEETVPEGWIGAYSPKSRELRIKKFLAKRKHRVSWVKRVKYDVRKNLADSRLRVKGRFVKMEDEATKRKP